MIKRYEALDGEMYPTHDGEYVHFEDYQLIEADNASLRKSLAEAASMVLNLEAQIVSMKAHYMGQVSGPPLCPHGFEIYKNICGICSEGRPNKVTAPQRCSESKQGD